jgi:iron complex outermembrane recepter protein
MKKIFFMSVLALLCFTINAQNKLTGRVISQDSLPLEGVNVIVPEINKGTTTNQNGYYELINLPNGKVKIQFSMLGHSTKIEPVILEGSTDTINITLNETAIETEEIVVTGGYNSTQHENAVKIDVLKINQITDKTTTNFGEILTKIPGVDMISKGNGISKPVIRGLSMNDILVLNNNVRFENYQYSDHHPLGIDEFGIDNIEVIKGPASLLYGSDAIGGVINFIREKPAPQNSVAGDYNLKLFSNSLGAVNNIGVKAASDELFGGIRFGQKTNSDYLQGGGDFVPNSRFNEYSIKTAIGYSGKSGILKFFYDYNHENIGLVEDEPLEEITKRGRKSEIYYQQFITHLVSSQSKFYMGKSKLEANVSYQNTQLVHFGEKDFYELQMRLATLSYDARLYFPSDKYSEYILGFQGINQQNNNVKNRETILLPDADIDNYSVFGLMQRTFSQKLKIQAGARYDYKTISTQAVGKVDMLNYRRPLDKNYGSFSGSFGATYNLSEELLFRGNVAAAYRTPNLAELTSFGQHETRFEVGDQHLNPENSYESDLSLHYHTNFFMFDLAGFYNCIHDYIFISPIGSETDTGIPIYKYMQNNSHLYGGEAGLHIHPGFARWLHFQTSYSMVIGKQESGDYLPFIPASKLNVELRAEKERLLFATKAFISLNSYTASSQNKAAPDETPTKGYTLCDLSLGGILKIGNQDVSVALCANNITDKKYIDHLSTLKEVNMYNPGRNFCISVILPFNCKPEK